MLNLVLSIIKHSKWLFNEGRYTESYQLIKKTHIYLKTHLQKLEIFTQDTLIALIYNNIACIFFKQNKKENALKQVLKAIHILEKSDQGQQRHQILYSQYNQMNIISQCQQLSLLPFCICKKKIVQSQDNYIKLTRQHYKKKQNPQKQQFLESMIVLDQDILEFKDLSWLERENEVFRITEFTDEMIVERYEDNQKSFEIDQESQDLIRVLEEELQLDSSTLMRLLVEKSRKKLKQLSQKQKNNKKSINNYRNKLASLSIDEEELETILDLSQKL